jgi:hypothetical protein
MLTQRGCWSAIYRVTDRTARVGLCLITVTFIFPAVAWAGGALSPSTAPSGHEAQEAGRWAVVIALAFLVAGVPLIAWGLRGIWWLISGRGKGTAAPTLWWGRSLVVGQDNRVSTSKTAALVWSYTLAGALLSFVIARWLGHPEGLDQLNEQGLNAQYAVLVGGPLGAAILAKGIVSAQVDSGDSAKPTADSATPVQLVQNDAGQTDLGDLQYLLFNVVALVFFYGDLLRVPQAGLPTIPDVLIGLTSVAAVGFVGKKALAGPPSINEVRPTAAVPGAHVRIASSGIVKNEGDFPALTVAFGAARADEIHPTTTTTAGMLIDTVVPPDAAGEVDLEVSVPTGKKAEWPGFKVVPEIGQRIAAEPGETVEVSTKGVTGLGSGLPGLKLYIEGQPVEAKVGRAGNIRLAIPTDLLPGQYKVALTTPGGSAEADLHVTAPPAGP